jgi:anaerobic sulfite reductase subunit B
VIASAAARPEPAPAALLPLPYRVARRRPETHDTWTLELRPDGDAAPGFAPGQFAMLHVAGAGEVPISVSAVGGGGLVHTVRAVGAVTARICALREGDPIGVRGPFGTAWPLADAAGRDVVVVAGGIGLAPLRPVVHELAARRERYGRVSVLYGGRSPDELLYRDELAGWGAQVIVDAAGRDWRGRVGVVTQLVPAMAADPREALAMLCGPEPMMRFAGAALAARGMPAASVWLSLERSMKCAVGHCGHCQLGPLLVCRDGPVVRADRVAPLTQVREL